MNEVSPIKIFHFHNGSGGGVLSVIRNLLTFRQSSFIENHVIYTINKEEISTFNVPNLEGATSERVFYYSRNWNFYHTCRELASYLPDSKSIIVAHDWIELGMISNLGLTNPTVHFLHGDYDYYYRLASMHEDSIDKYICVADRISNHLKLILPRGANAVHYLRFPVPDFSQPKLKDSDFNIVFAGRCEISKGYDLLPVINEIIIQHSQNVHWHIAGPGSDSEEVQRLWHADNVNFYGNLEQKEVQRLLCKADVFVLPSLAEGMPVSVVEAMKAGAIPLVNDLKGGLQEIINDGFTGFRINNNNPLLFAERLLTLISDENLRKKMSTAATEFANDYFSPKINTFYIEQVLISSLENVKIKKAQKIYGSLLDQPMIPNIIVSFIRFAIKFLGLRQRV